MAHQAMAERFRGIERRAKRPARALLTLRGGEVTSAQRATTRRKRHSTPQPRAVHASASLFVDEAPSDQWLPVSAVSAKSMATVLLMLNLMIPSPAMW